MPRKVDDSCVLCCACQSECPVGAIAEGDGKMEVNPDLCIDCGACEAVCPTGAISEA